MIVNNFSFSKCQFSYRITLFHYRKNSDNWTDTWKLKNYWQSFHAHTKYSWIPALYLENLSRVTMYRWTNRLMVKNFFFVILRSLFVQKCKKKNLISTHFNTVRIWDKESENGINELHWTLIHLFAASKRFKANKANRFIGKNRRPYLTVEVSTLTVTNTSRDISSGQPAAKKDNN